MKTRRGSSLWGDTDGLSLMITRFQPGDIVVPVTSKQDHFLGVVKEVLPKINKVMVLWNGGSLKQHDPDEIYLEPHQNEIVRTRMSSTRRGNETVVAKELVGSPKEYHWTTNIGRAKYVVNFHDGVSTHKDGSEFYDMRIFKNRPDMEAFIAELVSKGYKEGKPSIYK